MNKKSKIFIAGEQGFVGRNILAHLKGKGYDNFISAPIEMDFRKQDLIGNFIKENKPEIIILSAGKVGGIMANKKYPAEFLYDNLMIWTNIISSAAENHVEKLIFLGSATVYPEDAEVPFKEEYLLNGKMERNTEPYAIAKITAIILCEVLYRSKECNFIPLTLANLYGPYDHFDTEDSHVIPALISKIYKAKKEGKKIVTLWGTGKPTRDLLFVEDLAKAIEYVLMNINATMIFGQDISHLNVGTGKEISIKEISETIKKVLDFDGEIIFDTSNPDGTPRKFLDVNKMLNLGWEAKTPLSKGIEKTIEYYISNIKGS